MKKTSNARLRRIVAMIAALTILLSCLAGCSKKNPEDDQTIPDSTPPTAATTLPPETTEATTPTETTPPSVWGTVNTNNLNIRTNPSSTSTILGQFDAGTRVEILEQQTTDGVNWGRLEQGWVNLLFVTLDGQNTGVQEEEKPNDSTTPTESTTVEVSGTATNKSGNVTASELNIRKGPGTSYDSVGKYKKGDKVTITEVKGDWGKTNKGWINMKYVNTGSTTSSTTSDSNTTTDSKYTTLVTNGATKSLGTVKITIGALNVRYGPGSSYEKVTAVTNGTSHTYFQKSGDWVRIKDGWIYTKGYAEIDGSSSSAGSSGSTTATTGTGTTTSGLNIRKEPTAKADKVGEYKEGTKVTITEVKDGWGKTDKGWINLKYVKMDSTTSSGSGTTTEKEVGKNTTFKTGTATVEVNTKLTIRKEAKSDGEKVGSYKNGDKVTITEVSGEWGKTDKGWISLKYVKFD